MLNELPASWLVAVTLPAVNVPVTLAVVPTVKAPVTDVVLPVDAPSTVLPLTSRLAPVVPDAPEMVTPVPLTCNWAEFAPTPLPSVRVT